MTIRYRPEVTWKDLEQKMQGIKEKYLSREIERVPCDKIPFTIIKPWGKTRQKFVYLLPGDINAFERI